MRNLLQFLYKDSQDQNLDNESLTDLFEAAEDLEKLEFGSKPLAAALKELGITGELESCPNGVRLVYTDEDAYNIDHHKVTAPESAYPLAVAGWVATGSADIADVETEPKYVLHFISINPSEVDDKTDAEDLEKIIKQAQELDDAHAADTQPSGGVEHQYTKENRKRKNVDADAEALVEKLLNDIHLK